MKISGTMEIFLFLSMVGALLFLLYVFRKRDRKHLQEFPGQTMESTDILAGGQKEQYHGAVRYGFVECLRSRLDEIHDAKPYIVISAIVFFCSMIAGFALSDRLLVMMESLVPLVDSIRQEQGLGVVMIILLKNFIACVFVAWLGIFWGIIPLFSSMFNGMVLGIAVQWAIDKGTRAITVFLLIVPHSIFELAAVFIAQGLGLWIGMYWFQRTDQHSLSLRDRLFAVNKSLLVTVLPLLTVAAIIEGMSIFLFN